MTKSSRSSEIEEINKQVLLQSGIPNAIIRKIQKVRPVGKHIEFKPTQKPYFPQRVIPTNQAKTFESPVFVVEEMNPVHGSGTGTGAATGEIDMAESEVSDEDGHANEAFEAIEAMDFDASAAFDYDSEHHGRNDLAIS